jgi:hypothetical protein
VISKPYYPESSFLTSLKSGRAHIETGFHLAQNYPNPFNPSTRIHYQLAEKTTVDLSIYNILGEKVATLVSGEQPAGNHQAQWHATAHAGGIYIYTLHSGSFSQQRKMVLLR